MKTLTIGVLAATVVFNTPWVSISVTESKVSTDGQTDVSHSPFARLRPVPAHAVTLGEGIWNARFRINADTSIPEFYKHLERAGALNKLRGRKNTARGNSDADVAKWIEAASFVLQSENNDVVRRLLRSAVDDILASTDSGGYLDKRYMVRMPSELAGFRPGGYLYCLGHLLQAALAYRQATGDDRLLNVLIPYVGNLISQFGSGKKPCWSGHPEIEQALVELYKTTGETKYLDLAHYLLDEVDLTRDHRASDIDFDHYFAGAPISSRPALTGHAVCALYSCCGAAGLYMETGDKVIMQTLTSLWGDLTQHKMYITGGVGSRPSDEAIGDPYELPNERGYAETCAAIANIMWSSQMLNATGQARFADVMELALYNGFLSGVSVDGRSYFYWNPLASRSGTSKEGQLTDDNLIATKKVMGIGLDVRQPYYSTPCCIPNAQRMIASLPRYIYGTSSEGLWVHLYHSSRLDWHLFDGAKVALVQKTRYPWQNTSEIVVERSASRQFSLFLRVPYWAEKVTVTINGRTPRVLRVPGSYYRVRRRWRANDRVEIAFDMPIRAVHSNPLVRENTGCIALQRGPIVYCLESPDHQDVSVFDIVLPSDLSDINDILETRFEPDLLGGVVTLGGSVSKYQSSLADDRLYSFTPFQEALKPATIKAIPYFAWANRGPSEMTVWIRQRQ